MGLVEILKNTEKRKEEKPLLIFWCMSLKSPPTHVPAGTQTYTYMHTHTHSRVLGRIHRVFCPPLFLLNHVISAFHVALNQH